MNKKTIIIGGVAGGATTAARLRRRDEAMEIILFEKGDYISYANCGLPYYVGGVIKERNKLLLQTPEAMKSKFGIDVRVASEVTAIDTEAKCVTVLQTGTGETYRETYDNLVIATGSVPLRPPIPGIDAENIFTVWTVPDTDRIKEFLESKKPRSAVVVGGGFIGLEMAENLWELGIKVTLVEKQDQIMPPLDLEMAKLLHENMRNNQVDLILGEAVTSFEPRDGRTAVHLESGTEVLADLIVLSIGVRPNSRLAGEAGIALNAKGGIRVDEQLRTSAEGVYAVGDVIEVNQLITGKPAMIPLAGPANKQARICADNIAGGRKRYSGSMGTSVAKVFDLTAASTGLNERMLQGDGMKKGQDYETVLINQKSHAGYYPDASTLTLKLIFNREGRIYGAQIVGRDGADKRIDTIAAVIKLKGTIYDLMELELAYAPPFSSAKDPVNMLGFVAENVIDGLVSFIEADELDRLRQDTRAQNQLIILDVMEGWEREAYAIDGSVHIPLGELRGRLGELDHSRLIVIYCAVGVRAYYAARILKQSGFQQVKVLSGGLTFYRSVNAVLYYG